MAVGVPPRDVILVVQRRVRNHDAPDCDRRQPCNRRQRPRATNLDVDALQMRPCGFGGELVRDGPARCGRADTQPFLQLQVVDLVDDAVDVIAKVGARGRDLRVLRQQVIRSAAPARDRIGRKPQVSQAFQCPELRVGQRRADLAPGIGEKAERARRRYRRIQLSQTARGGVARIGKDLGIRCCLPGIQRGEVGMRHIDFAAHFQNVGRVDQRLGDIRNRAGVRRHILADLAIAACHGMDQRACLIPQRQAQPVDLWLGGIGQRRVRFQIEVSPDAGIEVLHVGGVEGITQRQHANRMADLAEAVGRRGTDLFSDAVIRFEVWKSRLYRGDPAFERVERRIVHYRIIRAVIGRISLRQDWAERRQFRPGLRFGQIVDRNVPFPRHPAPLRPIASPYGSKTPLRRFPPIRDGRTSSRTVR